MIWCVILTMGLRQAGDSRYGEAYGSWGEGGAGGFASERKPKSVRANVACLLGNGLIDSSL